MLDRIGRAMLAAFIGLTLAGLPAGMARAQLDASDPRSAEIRTRYGEAERLYEAGDFAGALAEFGRIYELLEGNPRRFFVLYNIALCQEALFRYGHALASYQRFLAEGGASAPQAPQARARLAGLERRLATLSIRSNTTAKVWVDGRHVGRAPGDIRVDAGCHTVELRAQGYLPARANVQTAARMRQTLTVVLDPRGAGLDPALAVTGAALTAVALAIGAGFGVAALAERSAIEERLASNEEAERFQVARAQIAALEETALFADVFLGAAAVLGVASAVLAFVTD